MLQLIKTHHKLFLLLLVSVVIVFVYFFFTKNPVKLLPLSGVDSLLALDNSLYFSSDKKIMAFSLTKGGSSSLIASDTTSVIPSPGGAKIYFSTGAGKTAKTYIITTDDASKKERSLPDEFFWKNNEGLFVEYVGPLSNIYSETKEKQYADLPFYSFISFAGIVLGSEGSETPEDQGYKWKVVNKFSAPFNTIEILDYKEETAPWITADYLLYINSNNNLVSINKKGQRKTINSQIDKALLTSSPGDLQYFIDPSGDEIKIKSVNLSNGKISDIKSVNIGDLAKKNKINTSAITQVYEKNNVLYLLIDKRILSVNLSL